MGSFFSSIFGESKDEDKTAPPPTAEKPETESKGDDEFARKLMEAQNQFRLKHGADPLTLDQELCNDAQKWAEHLAKMNSLQHADTEDGENLAFSGPTLTAQQAADMWYEEIKDYDFNKPGFTSGTGHFTQLVWVGSKQFGAGFAKGSNGGYAVGRYRPAGNVTNAGYFESNVLPAK